MIVCTKCETPKEEDEFHNRYNRKGGKAKEAQCKECRNAYHKIPANAQRRREAVNRSNKKVRKEVLLHYSDGLMKCGCCGESQIRFLTIDHINNDGAEHRKRIGRGSLYRHLKTNGLPDGFRVLCFNCNCGRAYNNGICPHEEM